MARPGLVKHPKFLRLVHLLGEPRAHVRGHLESMWEVSYECGDPVLGDPLSVELAAEWGGQAGMFFKSALECGGEGHAGFIEKVEERENEYQVHDLWHHAPDYVKKRAEREAARIARGKTISDMRREAGKRGAEAKWAKPESGVDGKPMANGDACYPKDGKRMANGLTPSPSPSPKEITPAGAGGRASEVPPGLLELIDGWNELPPGVVRKGNGARRDPPAKAAVTGWRRAEKEPEQREAFRDIPGILRAIRGARYCHGQGWFTLPWLFGTNKNREFNIVKLLAGAHDGDGAADPQTDREINYLN